MKYRRIIVLGAAMVMAAFLLGACGKTDTGNDSQTASKQESQQPEAQEEASAESSETQEETPEEASAGITFPLEETMEFTGLAIMSNTYNLSDNLAWNTALDRANIQIKLTELPPAEIGEKGNLIMSSGDYPEVLYKCGSLNLDEYGLEGVLIPLEDLIREYAPNLCAVLDERNGWNDITASDGHVYSLPHVQPGYLTGWGDGCLWINKAWLDRLSLEEPRNMEELYEVLKAFKENDANGNGDPDDEIPLTFLDWNLRAWLSYLGDGLHYSDRYCAIMDGELVYYPLTEGFRDKYLAYFAKLYEEGLLDKNGFTQTQDQQTAIGGSAEVYGVMFASSPTYAPETSKTNYVTLKFDEKTYPLNTGIGIGGLAITDKCENPEVIIAWADYFYTEEGGILARMGVEGESYAMNDDGTYTNIDDNPKYESRIFQCTLMGYAQLPVLIPDLYFNPSPVDSPVQAHYEKERFNEGGVFSKGVLVPTLKFTEEENKVLSAEGADISAYIGNYSAQVITGTVSLEDTWEDFQSTLKEMGVEKLEGVYKAAYERAVSASR